MKTISVPLLKQGRNACGPTALAMVLRYFHDQTSIQDIIKGVGGLRSYGVQTIDLANYARTLGYNAHCFSYRKTKSKYIIVTKPSTQLILRYLTKRLPVIIAVRTFLLNDLKPSKEGHFIVITKYQNGSFWFNDPYIGRARRIKEDHLLLAWFNNVLDSTAYMLVLEPKSK